MPVITHPWAPVCEADARVLILGSIPSPKSRELGFYYAHPQNCFWQTLAQVLRAPVPSPDAASRTAFLKRNRVALWDVLHACEIDGASDSSIRNPVPNRFRPLLEASGIAAIFTAGKKATALFQAHCREEAGMQPAYLPSTSPANRAQQGRPEFMEQWMRLRAYL
ncbi:MAG: DNA-deoxyinosine glycosylase [Clostridiales Family XIII bacterium]|nr:DNA-deoxyinosine glycosylase [Clostridiales Family XIII bacterium]